MPPVTRTDLGSLSFIDGDQPPVVVQQAAFSMADLVTKKGGNWFRADQGITTSSNVGLLFQLWRALAGKNFTALAASSPEQRVPTGGVPEYVVALDGTKYMVSAMTAAECKFMHQTGFTFFGVLRNTGGAGVQKIFDTCNGNLFQVGISLEFNVGTGRFDLLVSNGSGTAVFYNGVAGQTLTNFGIFETEWSVETGASVRLNGGPQVGGDVVGTPSSSNPSGTLTMGTIVAASIQFLVGQFAEWVIFPGVLTKEERDNVRSYLQAQHASLGLKLTTMTELPPSTDTTSDPHIMIPGKLYGVTGRSLELYKNNVVALQGETPQVLTSTMTKYDLFDDRYRFFPTQAQNESIIFSCNGYSRTSRVQVSAPLAGGAPTRNLVCIGDSLTSPGAGTYVQYIKDSLGAKVNLLGTVAGGGYPNQGQPGATWPWFATDPASPLTDAGGNLDIPAYITAIGATPAWIIYFLNTNDINSVGAVSLLNATIVAAYQNANRIMAAFRAAVPTIKQLVCVTPRGNMRDSVWSSAAARVFYQEKWLAFSEQMMVTFGNREAENIYLACPNISLNLFSYTDNVHLDTDNQRNASKPMEYALVANW